MDRDRNSRTGLARAVRLWALAGGAILLALVGLNVWSVAADAIRGRPFPGTIELTELGVAVAVFAFLPYCQMTGANVAVDIFTLRAPPRATAAMALAGSVLALCTALVLGWRMGAGLGDLRAANLTTTILQIPVWTAFVPITGSLALLALVSARSCLGAFRSCAGS